jgi:hypothetical protein
LAMRRKNVAFQDLTLCSRRKQLKLFDNKTGSGKVMEPDTGRMEIRCRVQ